MGNDHLEAEGVIEAPARPFDKEEPGSRRIAQTDRPSVAVIIPCFNEHDSLTALFEQLADLECTAADRYDMSFLFVDDGSIDPTWPFLRDVTSDRPNWTAIRHETNRGVAAAIMTGIRTATTEIVCSIDADCTYSPLLLNKMLPLLDGGADLVTASPYHPRGRVEGVPRWRLALSRICSVAYRVVLRNKLFTYTSCFRVYRRSAVAPIVLREEHFGGIAELLVQLDTRGAEIVEFPATLTTRSRGVSKMRLFPTVWSHTKTLARAAFHGRSSDVGRNKPREVPTAPRNDEIGMTNE